VFVFKLLNMSVQLFGCPVVSYLIKLNDLVKLMCLSSSYGILQTSQSRYFKT